MMTKEMTGEQLNRRYHELCGWRFESYGNGGGCWHHPNCEGVKRGDDNHPASCHWMLPALHTDANLAIAEATKVFGAEWFVGGISDTVKQYFVAPDMAVPFDRHIVTSFCEAILKAMIAAKEPR